MGRIAPRRRRSTGLYQPLLRTWLSIRQRIARKAAPDDEALPPEQPSEYAAEQQPLQEQEPQADKITRLKARLCQIWHLPDNFHWMSPLPLFHRRWLFVALAVLLLALIWPSSSDTPPQPVSLGFSPDGQVVQETAQDNQNNNPDWQHFQIQAGETLAQLFRNNRLTVNDVFAMAQVEGPDKPLSNLKAGQQIND